MKYLGETSLKKLLNLIKTNFFQKSESQEATLVDIPETPEDIGAIADPATKSANQVLTYNGSAWVAAAASGGVTDVKVNGTSVVSGGVATIPTADTSSYGVVKIGSNANTVAAGNHTHSTYMDKVAVTSADNGKFLQVVNGAWTAVTVPNAESSSF